MRNPYKGVRQQHHSISWTNYRIMGVSYRQTSFGHGYHGFWQSLHHCVLDMSVFGGVWMFLWRVRLQRGQSFAAKCFIFWETLPSNYMNCICGKSNTQDYRQAKTLDSQSIKSSNFHRSALCDDMYENKRSAQATFTLQALLLNPDFYCPGISVSTVLVPVWKVTHIRNEHEQTSTVKRPGHTNEQQQMASCLRDRASWKLVK